MKVKIEVTQEDIEKALDFRAKNRETFSIKDSPALTCPIAQAMHRIGSKHLAAGTNGPYAIYEDGTDTEFFSRFPKKAKRFINNFDDGDKVDPFAFWTQIPARFLKKEEAA